MSPTIALLVLALGRQDGPEARTSAIYRCPAAEAESEYFQRLVTDYAFDSFCIDPKPGPEAEKVAKGPVKIKFVASATVDTPANLKWRNLAMQFVAGKLSPRAWLDATKGLKETVHFLANPQTPSLWKATGGDSSRAVFAELLVLSWPGKPCLNAAETSRTHELPEAGALQSWLLAMNDHLGPMLYNRAHLPFLATQAPTIVRADTKPGLLIFRQTNGKVSQTFYLNNGPTPVELPPVDTAHLTMNKGLNLGDAKDTLQPTGFFIEEHGSDQ